MVTVSDKDAAEPWSQRSFTDCPSKILLHLRLFQLITASTRRAARKPPSTSLFSNRRNENDLVKHTRRAYPVSRHSPSERSPARQIGIRMALGAKHAKVAQLILGWMSRRVFAGLLLGLGLPLAVGGGRLISSQLYGISSWDPMALMIAASALAMSAFAAGIIPSTRAASISPMEALRME